MSAVNTLAPNNIVASPQNSSGAKANTSAVLNPGSNSEIAKSLHQPTNKLTQSETKAVRKVNNFSKKFLKLSTLLGALGFGTLAVLVNMVVGIPFLTAIPGSLFVIFALVHVALPKADKAQGGGVYSTEDALSLIDRISGTAEAPADYSIIFDKEQGSMIKEAVENLTTSIDKARFGASMNETVIKKLKRLENIFNSLDKSLQNSNRVMNNEGFNMGNSRQREDFLQVNADKRKAIQQYLKALTPFMDRIRKDEAEKNKYIDLKVV